jgi:hypothetical protein
MDHGCQPKALMGGTTDSILGLTASLIASAMTDRHSQALWAPGFSES